MSLIENRWIDPTPEEFGIYRSVIPEASPTTPEGRWERRTAIRGGMGSRRIAGVKGAWWTDWVGRRHWAIYAYSPGVNFYARWECPPVTEIYPEAVSVRRRPGGGQEAVAACDCGATGTLAEVAWMGPCCGPCHDRAEEAGRGDAPGSANRHLFRAGSLGDVPPVFSADGKLLALGTREGVVRVWEVRTGKEWAPLPNPPDTVRALAFSPDGLLLLAAGGATHSGRCRVHLWDLASRTAVSPRRMDNPVERMCFAPTSRRLATSWDGGTEVWNLVSRRNWRPNYVDPMESVPLAFSPDGNLLIVGQRRQAGLIDLRENRRRPLDFARGERPLIHDAAFGPRGSPVLLTTESAGWAGHATLRLREGAASPRVRLDLEMRAEEPGDCRASLTRDLRHVIALDGQRGMLRFWETGTGTYLGDLRWAGSNPEHVVLSPLGDLLATTHPEERAVRLWPWRGLLGVRGL